MSVEPEFSVIVNLSSLPKAGKTFSLAPSESERAAVAARLGSPRIDVFEGEVHIKATAQRIDVSGCVRAQMLRECVASLEEMDETVDDRFDLEFVRVDSAKDHGIVEDDAVDEPEPHSGDALDIGEILVQQLSLAMNPFPRKEGAESLARSYGGGASVTPFSAALRDALKSK
ncbi:MAG: hypothetical protein AAFW81_04045 [Pseudomonadota bacterium]